MKLIQQSNRYFLYIVLGVLPIAGIVLYFVLYFFITGEINEKLKVDELRIVKQLEMNPEIINLEPVIEAHAVNEEEMEPQITDVYVYDPIEKEDELFRELSTIKKINGVNYSIKIRHSLIEAKDMIAAVGITIAIIIFILMAVVYLLNRKLSQKLWKPFYSNLDSLQHFSLEETKPLQLEESSIDEFETLKESLEKLTNKIINDYNSLKEFTENASHEIQTPLSIIMMNLDEAMQKDLDEATYSSLYSSYQAAKRLSKLNEKLLLLTKLENNQYKSDSQINLSTLIKEKLEELSPLFETRQLKIVADFKSDYMLNMDSMLANILVTNLLSNAVKHNVNKGTISVFSNSEELRIENTTDNKVDDHVFERFTKSENNSDSTGLGLAIVKKIAEKFNMDVSVNQKGNLAIFTLRNNS